MNLFLKPQSKVDYIPKEVMFNVAERVFNVAEHVFNDAEHVFNDVEYKLHTASMTSLLWFNILFWGLCGLFQAILCTFACKIIKRWI